MSQDDVGELCHNFRRENFCCHIRDLIGGVNLGELSPSFVDKLPDIVIFRFNMPELALRYITFLGVYGGLRILKKFKGG